jgi:hypothetical protein
MKANSSPIFVGGLDRCGKTTLRAFLVSHPNISIPAVGSNMWTYFYGQFGDLNDPTNFERCMSAMLQYKHVRFLKPDAEEIRKMFKQGPATYGRLFGLFLEQHARRAGKPRWGEQTGLIERYADRVLETFPDGRMLHMIRDPRDRYVESLKMWPNGNGRAGGAVARWLYTTSLARRNLKKYPSQYMVVRFEDLVHEPETTLRSICLSSAKNISHKCSPWRVRPIIAQNSNAARNDPQKARRFRMNTSAYTVTDSRNMSLLSCKTWLAPACTSLSMTLEPIHFSLLERLAYIGWRWHVNFIRMIAWLGIEYVQHSFPQIFGRKPASKMVIKDATV